MKKIATSNEASRNEEITHIADVLHLAAQVDTLSAFIEWVVQAIGYVPLSEEAKPILDKLLDIQAQWKQELEQRKTRLPESQRIKLPACPKAPPNEQASTVEPSSL
ncbi:MAG: hypothetical protein J2P36_14050 [Ktedonobacteraceae bacterium]|nr:hypothetical protein [Ktedonobacteraceae bacterium]